MSYEVKVDVFRSEKTGEVIPNQYILFDYSKNRIYFQSYNVTIAKVENPFNFRLEKITLYPLYNHSRTTSKYLYKFLQKYTLCNITCKKELEKTIENGVIQLVEE